MTETVGIIGAGTMGRGIAAAAAVAGYDVYLTDSSPDTLQAAPPRIESELQHAASRGKLSVEDARNAHARISIRHSIEELKQSGYIIETVIENLPVKQEIFKTLDQICSPDVILATNTSSLSVTAIASVVRDRGRVIGLHFFNPPLQMKLVEIIAGSGSTEETINRVRQFSKSLGKTAVFVHDTPGFIVNRVARPFYGEALKILGEGIASVEEIDRIVRLEGGFRMGPFELMDLIGIDVNLAVTTSIYEQTYGEPRYRPHLIQQQMVASGKLGRKTGRGFYSYQK